jgi:hypothetical protein
MTLLRTAEVMSMASPAFCRVIISSCTFWVLPVAKSWIMRDFSACISLTLARESSMVSAKDWAASLLALPVFFPPSGPLGFRMSSLAAE